MDLLVQQKDFIADMCDLWDEVYKNKPALDEHDKGLSQAILDYVKLEMALLNLSFAPQNMFSTSVFII